MTDTDDNFFDFDTIGHFVIIGFVACLFAVAGYSAFAG